jgi:hypothetical protein
MSEWKYGDILRRAVTMNPPVYQYLMYLGPGGPGSPDNITAMRLTPFIHAINGRLFTAENVGFVSRFFAGRNFEAVPQ